MNKILFLDRDGIINYDEGYTCKVENFHFVDGIFELCRSFKEHGFLIVVVTNQAGIARGYYTEDDFKLLTEWMVDRFRDNGVEVDDVYYCPYHEAEGIGKYKRKTLDRKPGPGMLLRAQKKYDADMQSSVMIGDKPSDMVAGMNAGVGTLLLVSEVPYPFEDALYFKDLNSCLLYCREKILI